MRIAPIGPRRLTIRQDLRGIVLRMISTNSLSAFTPEVTFAPLAERVRGVTPTPGVGREASDPAQRPLEIVPGLPKGPLPRGSLLDVRA